MDFPNPSFGTPMTPKPKRISDGDEVALLFRSMTNARGWRAHNCSVVSSIVYCGGGEVDGCAIEETK